MRSAEIDGLQPVWKRAERSDALGVEGMSREMRPRPPQGTKMHIEHTLWGQVRVRRGTGGARTGQLRPLLRRRKEEDTRQHYARRPSAGPQADPLCRRRSGGRRYSHGHLRLDGEEGRSGPPAASCGRL